MRMHTWANSDHGTDRSLRAPLTRITPGRGRVMVAKG
jgi:hypothetical protein